MAKVPASTRPSPGADGPLSSPSEPLQASSGQWSQAFDLIFRFLSSLKLAVFSLLSLAGVLAYATFHEKWYGTAAVQDDVYRSPWFAVLLAFLGVNILCAALIRYPWKRRQIGFVVTHAGLLVVLLGSWISFMVTDDGQVGMVEGDQSSELVKIDRAAIWVQPIEKAGESNQESSVAYKLPFHGGAYAWNWNAEDATADSGNGTVRLLAGAACAGFALGAILLLVIGGTGQLARLPAAARWGLGLGMALASVWCLALAASNRGDRQELLTTPAEPFQVIVKNYYPASTPVLFRPRAGEGGTPMVKVSLAITPPNSDRQIDIFARFDDGSDVVRWLRAENKRLKRAGRDLGLVLVSFQYADLPEMVEDFLSLPEDPMAGDQIRLHYAENSGQRRVFVWPKEKAEGETLTLPDSDIQVKLERRSTLPLDALMDRGGEMTRATGETELHFVELNVQKGPGEGAKYIACSSLPSLPNKPGDDRPVVRVSYYRPPDLGENAMSGRSSVVEVLGTPEGKLYYRAFSREGLRGKGPLEVGKPIVLVSKSMNQPVNYRLEAEDYLVSGVDGQDCQSIELPPNERDAGVPAALVELKVGDQTRDVWVRRMHPTHDYRHLFRPLFDFQDQDGDGSDDRDGHLPRFETVRFPGGEAFRLGLDFDRRPLGFNIKLADFEMGTDPGTRQAASYESDVLLSDQNANVTDRPINISMNEPLTWKNHTFYQSNFQKVRDPSGRETGQFISVFQVRFDPSWCWGTVYGGCLLVVIGTFLQFAMRAGVFSGRRHAAPAGANGLAEQSAAGASSREVLAGAATETEEL